MTQGAVKDRYSLVELAALLDVTRQALEYRAKRDAWPSTETGGRGRGGMRREYLIPAELAKAIEARQVAERHARALAAPTPDIAAEATDKADADQQVLARLETLAAPQRARFEARKAVVAGFFEWLRLRGGRRSIKQYEAYVSGYNAGHLRNNPTFAMLAPAFGVLDAIGLRSLQRWVSGYERDGLSAFLDEKTGRHQRGLNEIERQPALRDLVLGLIIKVPHIKVRRLVEAATARFAGDDSVLVPHEAAFYRFVRTWKAQNAELYLAITNPDAWRNKDMVAHGDQSEGIVRPNQCWELDSSPMDVQLHDGRWALVACVDVATGRAKLLLTKTSTAAAIGQLLRACILDWGLPEMVKTDNGSDYTSEYVRLVLQALAVEHVLCPPFQPWHKSHVERFFRTFQHDLVELLPGFVGHNVTERKAIESRRAFSEQLTKKNAEILDVRMGSEEFNQFMTMWLSGYHGRAHGGQDGMTPDQAYAASAVSLRRLDDERVLDVLLAEAPGDGGYRTVQKKGLRLDGAWFIAPELGTCVGERVRVKLDETDLGWIYVFTADGGFLCRAACPERTGIDRREYAARARVLQKERISREKAALKAASRVDVGEVLDGILRDRASEAGKLVALPKPATQATTPGIQAAPCIAGWS